MFHDICRGAHTVFTAHTADLLKEGTLLKDAHIPLPHLSALGPNLGVATLSALIALKLSAARMQDLADIVELLKRRPYDSAAIISELPETLRAEFQKLEKQALRELH